MRLRPIALRFAVVLLLTGIFSGSAGRVTAQETIDCAAFPAAEPASEASPAAAAAAATSLAEPVAFPAEGGELTVFAAASLTDVFEQIATNIQATNPEVSITFNFAGSQALVTQLREGAEADVFAPANLAQMDAAFEAGAIAGEALIFARNQLVIIVPTDNPAGITAPVDLGNPGILFDIAQVEVPAGKYTRQSVCLMSKDAATYGDHFGARVDANIVSEEENIRAVVTKVALGEADAGVVYATDVTPDVADQVEIISIPKEVNIIAEYPIAAVTGGDSVLAQAFIDYLLGPDGQATLESFGFLSNP